TLVPLMENMLKSAEIGIESIDALAVSNGPGSFTGLRIGVSAVKGIAFAAKKPCIAVSSLEAMAYNCLLHNGVVCAVMDARCNQVYNALFRVEKGIVTRLCEDRALFIPDLAEELKNISEEILLVGDGADLTYKTINGENVTLAPPLLRYQNAVSVCFAAEKGREISAKELMPSYLRLPQAERERLAKINKVE
ncbi:MAG: tRNA (adenosine(37)-N6)-threonylcarbamoyltransferase complex dimerization subunit type 1 TsaB, partial [Ruminiclostridium sp.]